MGMNWRTKLISSLSHTILKYRYHHISDANILTINKEVITHLRLFPKWMTLPFSILLLIFNISGVSVGLKPFIYNSRNQQHLQYQQWKASSLNFKREFILLIESLAIFYYFNLNYFTLLHIIEQLYLYF